MSFTLILCNICYLEARTARLVDIRRPNILLIYLVLLTHTHIHTLNTHTTTKYHVFNELRSIFVCVWWILCFFFLLLEFRTNNAWALFLLIFMCSWERYTYFFLFFLSTRYSMFDKSRIYEAIKRWISLMFCQKAPATTEWNNQNKSIFEQLKAESYYLLHVRCAC